MRFLALALFLVCASAQANIGTIKVMDQATYKGESFSYAGGLFQLMNTPYNNGPNRWSIFVIANSTTVQGHGCGFTISSSDHAEIMDLFRLLTDKTVNLQVTVQNLIGGSPCQYHLDLQSSAISVQIP